MPDDLNVRKRHPLGHVTSDAKVSIIGAALTGSCQTGRPITKYVLEHLFKIKFLQCRHAMK